MDWHCIIKGTRQFVICVCVYILKAMHANLSHCKVKNVLLQRNYGKMASVI